MSTWVMKLLIIEYAVIFVACSIEGNWKLALYWLGAIIIQTSVILMGMK